MKTKKKEPKVFTSCSYLYPMHTVQFITSSQLLINLSIPSPSTICDNFLILVAGWRLLSTKMDKPTSKYFYRYMVGQRAIEFAHKIKHYVQCPFLFERFAVGSRLLSCTPFIYFNQIDTRLNNKQFQTIITAEKIF